MENWLSQYGLLLFEVLMSGTKRAKHTDVS